MLALADCAVTVRDAAASARWWVEKVGFRTHTVGSGEHSIMVAPPGDRFVLHLCEGFGEVEPGNTGIAFVTDEIEPLVERMRERGVLFPEPLRRESWGGMAKFADPDGNVFWLLGAPRKFIVSEVRRPASGGRAGAPKTPTRRPTRAPTASGRRSRATPKGR